VWCGTGWYAIPTRITVYMMGGRKRRALARPKQMYGGQCGFDRSTP